MVSPERKKEETCSFTFVRKERIPGERKILQVCLLKKRRAWRTQGRGGKILLLLSRRTEKRKKRGGKDLSLFPISNAEAEKRRIRESPKEKKESSLYLRLPKGR